MGQCHNCQRRCRSSRASVNSSDDKASLTRASVSSEDEKTSLTRSPICVKAKEDMGRGDGSGSDTSPDSGNASDESSNYGEPLVRGSSHSSDSSGRYSLKDNIGDSMKDNLGANCFNSYYHRGFDQRSNHQIGYPYVSILDLPVFPEANEDQNIPEDQSYIGSPGASSQTNNRPLSFLSFSSSASTKESKSSSGSETSNSSFGSITAVILSRLSRSTSLRVPPTSPDDTVASSCPSTLGIKHRKRPRRSVSLRLPKTSKSRKNNGNGGDSNIPTIYVDESPKSGSGTSGLSSSSSNSSGKMSMIRALSLLSVNSLLKNDTRQRKQKPVKKILRQPRRRHQTVRGLSGMAIDVSNQAVNSPYYNQSSYGNSNSSTLYYPTATSLRSAYANRHHTRSGA